MILEEQVISLEIAKKLSELGVKQNSIFYYDQNGNVVTGEQLIYYREYYSAFLAGELLEILPHTVEDYYTLNIIKYFDEYYISYDQINHGDHEDSITSVNEIHLIKGLAKMLIHLIESGIIEAPK